MAITKQKKEQIVGAYVERLSHSSAIVLANYRGMTVQQMQDLRRRMREKDASVQVVKNTLLKIALEQVGMPVPEAHLAGPVAVAYLPEDVATASKALLDYAKENERFSITGAVLEGQILDSKAAQRLVDLPTRSDVLAQLLGIVQGPASELVRTIEAPANELYRTIQAPLRELALTIQSYADKGAEAGA